MLWWFQRISSRRGGATSHQIPDSLRVSPLPPSIRINRNQPRQRENPKKNKLKDNKVPLRMLLKRANQKSKSILENVVEKSKSILENVVEKSKSMSKLESEMIGNIATLSLQAERSKSRQICRTYGMLLHPKLYSKSYLRCCPPTCFIVGIGTIDHGSL